MKANLYFTALLFIFLSGSSASAQQAAKRHADVVSISPDADRNIATGINFVKAVTGGDWAKAQTYMAPGFMHYGPGAADSANVEQYAKIWQENYTTQKNREVSITAGTSMQVKEGPQKGDWVLIWCDYKALFTDTGKTAGMPVQLTLQLKDGKVAVEQSYYDTGSMMMQLGWTLIPPKMAKK